MKDGEVEISDSNWWMNTNSDTINYIKTFSSITDSIIPQMDFLNYQDNYH